MTISHEDANARLIDLVYGEAPPAERAELEAHVAGCARCQTELAALGGTRAFVRAALVEQGAPKGAHARLLAAATEAVAPVASTRDVPAALAAPAPAGRTRALAPAEAPSLWQRLRRGWTVPTFATVGAFAILLLASKVFLSPARTYERGHEGFQGNAPPVPAARARVDETAPAGEAAAAPAAPRPREEARDEDSPRDLRRRAPGVARDKSTRPGPGSDGLSGVFGGARADDAPGAGAPRGSVGGVGRIGAGSGGGAFASPPTGWKGGAPARPAPAPPRVVAKKDVAEERDRAAPTASSSGDRKLADERAEREAPARAEAENVAAPAAPARAKVERVAAPEALAEKKKAAPEAAPSAVAAQAPSHDGPARNDADVSGVAASLEALARRAEQLYAAHRWDDAAVAFRELLRRYPAAEPAAKWRARLAEAERASADATASGVKSAAKKPARESAKPASAPAEQP